MLQTHYNPMSANIQPNSHDQFVDIPNQSHSNHSLINNLGISLKSSIQSVWNYLKTIDVKLPRSQIKTQSTQLNQYKNNNNPNQQAKPHNLEPSKTGSPSVPLQKSPNSQKRSFLQQLHTKDSTLSKKQRLHSKKQQKKVISFDDFMTEQQRKLNESYIRKNIEQKKTLNKSTLSQQNNNNLNSSTIESKQNLLSISQQNPGKSALKSAQKPLILNNSVLNPNNQTILNISDIDSECNFNILNNSDIYELSHKNLKPGDNDQDEDEQLDPKDINYKKKEQPKLQLSEYPFMTRGRKIQLPKLNNTYKNNFSSTNSKTPLNKVSSKSIPENHVDFIDVDNMPDTFNHKINEAIKRKYSGPVVADQIRKQVKQSFVYDFNDESQDSQAAERDLYFDRILEARYDFMIDDMLKNPPKTESTQKDQPASLKEDFARYVNKNFGAMQHVKNRLENHAKQTLKPSQKYTSSGQPKNKKQKISEILKPLDLSPKIQRKKLYNFTRDCESKISISIELQKSVREDRQRQAAEQRRKQKEQQDRRRKQEEERMRKEMQEKRRLEEIERKRIQQQQEALRITEQLQKQKEEEQRKKEQKESDQQAKQSQGQELKSSQTKTVNQDSKPDAVVAQDLKASDSKQTPKPLSAVTVAAASLFKNPTPEQSLSTTPKDGTETKDTEPGLFKKTASGIEMKPNETQNKSLSGSKEAQVTPSLEKKESQKDQKNKKQTKFNPFMMATVTNPVKPGISLLQQIVNSKKDENTLFKTVISNNPTPVTSPVRKPNQSNPSSFMSPVHTKHNTSLYSNHDQSMYDESESNITPANHLPNQGSFLNNSFSSQQNGGMFGNPTSNPLFSTNTGGSLFGNAYNPMTSGGMFGNQQQRSPASGSLFSNTQINMFGSSTAPSNIAATEAVTKVPSFMQNHPTIAPGIDPMNAVNLFNQRSPTKNESSLFSQAPSVSDKRSVMRRDKKSREERIR